MSDTTEGYPSITLRLEASWTTPNLGQHASVVVEIQGLGRRVSLVLPVFVIPQHVTIITCDRWLYAVQGTIVGACGVDEAWREVLVRLCLAYRAFVIGNPGANPEDWSCFSAQLAVIACHPDSSGQAYRLQALVEWVVTALPEDVFQDRIVSSLVEPSTPTCSRPAHIVLAPDGIAPSEQVARRLGIVRNLTVLILKALRAVPPDAQPDEFPFALVAHARVEDNMQTADDHFGRLDMEPEDDAYNMRAREPPSGDETRTARYLTIELPSSLVGSVTTPLVNILQQCTFRNVYRDDSTDILPNPVLTPTLCSRFSSTAAAPQSQSVRGHALIQSIPAKHVRVASAEAAISTSFPKATSLMHNPPSSTSSVRSPDRSRSRIRRSTTNVDMANASRRAAIEARRQEEREARAARAAARAARRTIDAIDRL